MNNPLTYYPNWLNKGVIFIKDVLNFDNEFLSLERLNEVYNLGETNFLNYYKIKLQVKQFMNQHNFFEMEHIPLTSPIFPFHVKILYKSKKGSRDMYNQININTTEPKMKNKWNHDLNLFIDPITWRQIFKTCFKVAQNTRLIWLQYRVLYRILGVKTYLCKLNIDNSDTCRLCSLEPETLVHLFAQCTKSRAFFENIKNWIQSKINITVDISTNNTILGYLNSDTNFIPINLILMVSKCYIFYCAATNKNLNFEILKRKIKNTFVDEQTIAQINGQREKFDKIWNRWKPIFNDV